jgi:hypothetical protein
MPFLRAAARRKDTAQTYQGRGCNAAGAGPRLVLLVAAGVALRPFDLLMKPCLGRDLLTNANATRLLLHTVFAKLSPEHTNDLFSAGFGFMPACNQDIGSTWIFFGCFIWWRQ